MFINSRYSIAPDEIKPIWTGNKWKYRGGLYRSSRELRTRSTYKQDERIAKIGADRIRKEIDREILEEIRSNAG